MTKKTEKEEAKNVLAEEQSGDASLAKVDENKPTVEEEGIRKRISDLAESIQDSTWELSKLLYDVSKRHLYRKWGFETFEEYVEEDMVFGIRKANYLKRIQEWLMGLPAELQEEIKDSDIGWAKVKEIAGMDDNKKIKSLVASAKDMPVGEFTDYARKVRNELDGGSDDTESMHRLAFQVLETELNNIEEAIKIGQEITQKGRSEALSLICTEFVGGHAVQKGEKIDIHHYLSQVERTTGLKIVALNEADKTIVFGHKTVEKITTEQAKSEEEGKDNE